MTDLELTKACAVAMGMGAEVSHGVVAIYEKLPDGELLQHIYDPLYDDAQAMALVKKLGLTCITELGQGRELWRVHHWRESGHALHPDLNRAICECVSRLPASEGGR